ncbi:hypothetical protein [Noviherbaspirillum aerium]|uniref:hypothetical protein n=1 Tax=Noviherbaspirillum aerium TaxID=2588497 RepID=UPI00178C5F35|nr:hypothetical protein [Noviherbaspirillum aerium]
MKNAKGDIDSLKRYGIADAARARSTAHILRTVTRQAQKQSVQPQAPKIPKAKTLA